MLFYQSSIILSWSFTGRTGWTLLMFWPLCPFSSLSLWQSPLMLIQSKSKSSNLINPMMLVQSTVKIDKSNSSNDVGPKWSSPNHPNQFIPVTNYHPFYKVLKFSDYSKRIKLDTALSVHSILTFDNHKNITFYSDNKKLLKTRKISDRRSWMV